MTQALQCPKCRQFSGDKWEQCEGSCPMDGSPCFDPRWNDRKHVPCRICGEPMPLVNAYICDECFDILAT